MKPSRLDVAELKGMVIRERFDIEVVEICKRMSVIIENVETTYTFEEY